MQPRYTLFQGDSAEILKSLPDDSIDSLVRNLFLSTHNVRGIKGTRLQDFPKSLHRSGCQKKRQDRCGGQTTPSQERSLFRHIVDIYHRPFFLRCGVKASNLFHSSEDDHHATPGCSRHGDGCCNTQESNMQSQNFSFSHCSCTRTLLRNSHKPVGEKLAFLFSFSPQQSSRPFLLWNIYMVPLRISLIFQASSRHNGTPSSKKQRAYFLFEKARAGNFSHKQDTPFLFFLKSFRFFQSCHTQSSNKFLSHALFSTGWPCMFFYTLDRIYLLMFSYTPRFIAMCYVMFYKIVTGQKEIKVNK